MQKAHTQEVVKGPFQQTLYSPHGTIEGVLIETAEGIAQLVFSHDADTGAFRELPSGALVVADCTFAGWASTRAGGHRVYDVEGIVSIAGKKPKAAKKVKRAPAYSGTVVSINYARHGEANGVVLDSGDFIHLRPEGFK